MDRVGRYEVVAEIGRGAMGRVYAARDPELQRQVAIKVLHSQHASVFREEARALAALNHPGIVTIHEIGEHQGQPYLVMELLRGQPLREVLQGAATRPSRARVVEICEKVATATAEAHAYGVLHRDIKPENVVVLASGGVKVVDFGIARRLDQDTTLETAPQTPRAVRERIVSAFAHTLPIHASRDPLATQPTAVATRPTATAAVLDGTTHTLFGTPAYMAPEVLAGRPSTEASDVYSLGVMLYECLAGRRPYEAPDLVTLISIVVDGSEAPPPLEDPLAPLVMRMIARDAQDRPTAREVAAALGTRARTAEPRAKPRGVRQLVLAALGALLVVGAGVWWMASSRASDLRGVREQPMIAVAPFDIAYQTYGDQPVRISEAFSVVLASIEGVRVIDPDYADVARAPRAERVRTARRLGARYLLQGKLVERAGEVTATLSLVDVESGKNEPITATAPVANNAALIVELANSVAMRIVPGARRTRARDPVLGRKLYDLGVAALNAQNWGSARPYLEQSVEADPSAWRAWDALASARGWTLAPQAWIEAAIKRALEGVPAGPRRSILEGAAHYFRHDYDAAVAVLEPLVGAPGLTSDDAIDVAYYLGEAFWHRGDHTRGAELFQIVFDARRFFEPAGVHLMQHAIVKRDLARAGVVIGRLGRSRHTYEFAAGDYATVASSGEFPIDLHAQLVLGRDPSRELEERLATYGYEGYAYRMARALAAGDTAAARDEVAALWQKVEARPVADRVLYELSPVLDVIASSGVRDMTLMMLAYLRSGTSPRYAAAYRRLALVSAPLIGGDLPELDGATQRDRRLADAIRAELAGDHRTAAARLGELVADPGDNWSFPERIALVRNLRAAGDEGQLAAQCNEISRPPVFRYDFLLARAACVSGGAAAGRAR